MSHYPPHVTYEIPPSPYDPPSDPPYDTSNNETLQGVDENIVPTQNFSEDNTHINHTVQRINPNQTNLTVSEALDSTEFNMPTPPIASYDSSDAAKKAVSAWGHSHGYDIAVGHHDRRKRIQLVCGRSGKPRPKTTHQRARSSHNVGCRFSFYIGPHEDGSWSVQYNRNEADSGLRHSPGPAKGATAAYRRFERSGSIREAVEGYVDAGIVPSEMLARLQEEFPDSCQTQRDVRNMLQFARRFACEEEGGGGGSDT